MPTAVTPTDPARDSFQDAMPAIQAVARRAFRKVRCPHRRADLVAEAVALCWAYFRAATAPRAIAAHLLAARAARAVRAGRRLADLPAAV